MGAAFEQAWMLLKAVFQPAEGYPIGEGMNQIVYGMEGDPDVTKVGPASTLGDMYIHQLLTPEVPIFAGQVPIAQTMPLTPEAEARFGSRAPVLSQQQRGIPLAEGSSPRADAIRGRELMQALYSHPHEQSALLEGLGLADIKPPNWMQTQGQQGLPVSSITGDPSLTGRAVIHDPMFYGAVNPKAFDEMMRAQAARGTPRKLGEDYFIPENVRESFARRVDALPYEQFVEPVFNYEVPMSPAQEQLLYDRVKQERKDSQSILGQIGVLG